MNSGAAGGLVDGIGVVSLLHSDGQEFYPVDFRVYAPDCDGKTKNDHFRDYLRAELRRPTVQAYCA